MRNALKGRFEESGLCSDEDGGLMVGASLKPNDFVQIINAANQE